MNFDKNKILPILSRILLGSIFLVYGLDGYYHFLPLAEPSSKGAEFLNALKNSGYFFYFLKGLETIAGALLVGNFFVPLALLILTPIVANIVLYGAFLDPQTLVVPGIILLCMGYLFWYYREIFKVFLRYQYYTSPDTEGKANILILDERDVSFKRKRSLHHHHHHHHEETHST